MTMLIPRSGVADEVLSETTIPRPIVHESGGHLAPERDRRTAPTYRPTTGKACSARAIPSGPAVYAKLGQFPRRPTWHRRSATPLIAPKCPPRGPPRLSDVAQAPREARLH